MIGTNAENIFQNTQKSKHLAICHANETPVPLLPALALINERHAMNDTSDYTPSGRTQTGHGLIRFRNKHLFSPGAWLSTAQPSSVKQWHISTWKLLSTSLELNTCSPRSALKAYPNATSHKKKKWEQKDKPNFKLKKEFNITERPKY